MITSHQTRELKSWDDIHALAVQRHRWVFRGQRLADWQLQSSLERCCNRERVPWAGRPYIESEGLREFRRSFHHYSDYVPAANAPLEWFATMQHHGAPTRLIDFSYSIYVALYFALESADDACAVWALDASWALQAGTELFRGMEKKTDADIERARGLFIDEDENVVRRLFFEDPAVKLIAPLNPFRLNERLRIQRGVFVVPGTVTAPFMDNLSALSGFDSPDRLVKIVVPFSFRQEGLERLHTMNVTSTTLFPGLDGFARSLGVYRPAFRQDRWAV